MPKKKASGVLADSPAGKKRYRDYSPSVEHEEILAAVCNYFCQGRTPSEIAELIQDHFGVKMNREIPYRLLQQAATRNLLQFIAPRADRLSKYINEQHPWLKKTEVVVTSETEDVAARAAVMLMESLREYRRPPYHKREVHIGFAGGNTVRQVAEKLAEQLKRPAGDLPPTLVFHALTAGFDVATPITDTNSFFTYFVDSAMQVETRFVMLHAPAMIRPGLMKEMLDLPEIKEPHQRVSELDIIVTSASSISDEHGTLARAHQDKSETAKLLKIDRCEGDMLWLPLSRQGPIDMSKYPYRSMILIELSALPSYIKRGVQVMLVLGPCGRCHEPKTKILDTILTQAAPLITHLVVDSQTARGLFEQHLSI